MAVGDLSMPIMHPVNGVRIGIAEYDPNISALFSD